MHDRQLVDLVQQLCAALGRRSASSDDSLSNLPHRVLSLVQQREALADVVDRLGIGVILAEGSGAVVWANRAAIQIAARAFPDEHMPARPEVARLVADATRNFAPSANRAAPAPDAVLASRSSDGRAALELLSVRSASSQALHVVCVADPDSSVRVNAETIRRLYGLTRTEARIVVLMMNGQRVQQIARALRISMNTARWHVKHVLQKTRAHTQAQAVRTILTGLAGLRGLLLVWPS